MSVTLDSLILGEIITWHPFLVLAIAAASVPAPRPCPGSTFSHTAGATRGTTNTANPNPLTPCLWPKSCIKPVTKHYGQLKILLENYYFTSLCSFLNSLIPIPKPEKENRKNNVAHSTSIERSALAYLSEARPPTSPLPQGAHYNSECRQKEKKNPNFTLTEKARATQMYNL